MECGIPQGEFLRSVYPKREPCVENRERATKKKGGRLVLKRNIGVVPPMRPHDFRGTFSLSQDPETDYVLDCYSSTNPHPIWGMTCRLLQLRSSTERATPIHMFPVNAEHLLYLDGSAHSARFGNGELLLKYLHNI